jgi:hypothetical protein
MPSFPITLQMAIAVAALLISLFVARRQSRVALRNLRLQRDNAIIQWSNRALDYLCSAEMILKQEYRSVMPQAEYEKVRLATMRDISSCIDHGRLFFPNLHHDTKGHHKPAVFRGSRHPVLDCLVFSHDLLGRLAIPRTFMLSKRTATRLSGSGANSSPTFNPSWIRGDLSVF